ncbi:MAG: DUF2195 family protein [Gammaproteobacteria bacterium]|nr:DUF2195 family protein [Gammaproteobacteria bacterium]
MAALKNKLYLTFMMGLSGIFSTSCNASDNVILDNSLKNCIDIKSITVTDSDNLLLLKTQWKIKDNIGTCGCKSAAFSYSVYIDGNDKLMSFGIMSSLNKSSSSFVLSSDNSIYKTSKYNISINCAN